MNIPPNGDCVISNILSDLNTRSAELEQERDRLSRLIHRHEKTLENLPRIGGKAVLDQIGGALVEQLRLRHRADFIFEVSGPFGLGPEWSISIQEPSGKLWCHMKFRGGSPDSMKLIEQTPSTNRFAPGTIGYNNGFNYQALPIPDHIADLVAIAEAQHESDRAQMEAAPK